MEACAGNSVQMGRANHQNQHIEQENQRVQQEQQQSQDHMVDLLQKFSEEVRKVEEPRTQVGGAAKPSTKKEV